MNSRVRIKSSSGNITSNCTNSLRVYTNENGSSQNETNSKIPEPSSELSIYTKSKKNGISVYEHIRTLLDMFIFQNPVEPIKYFEYYSQRLKQYYHKPIPNYDLNFLNNIERNIYNRIVELYKDTNKINNNNGTFLEEKDSNLSYGDVMEEYESEYQQELEEPVNSDEVIVQDLSKTNYMFSKAGCGITNEEASLIGMTMDQMSHLNKFKNIRYWGKILGLKQNYYVLECEWQSKELEYKLRLLNSLTNHNNDIVLNNYENMYENEEEIDIEKDTLSLEEQYDKYNYFSQSKSVQKKSTNKTDINSQISKPRCFPPPEHYTDDQLSYEMFGFGANKKSYFVTNHLSDSWIELPQLKPHHIIQSRNIKRYFVGDLESYVKSFPVFHGLEKHYLRAQIARITAATQISPRDFFVLDHRNKKSNRWRKLNPFQVKVLSQKWVHNYMENKNYYPPSVYKLLEPANWVHHTPLITEQGVTRAWARFKKSEKHGILDAEAENTTMDLDEDSNTGPDIFGILSDDAVIDNVSPWKFEMTNPFDHKATYVTIRSNLWPGAYAVTRKNLLDNTYCGWGHKFNTNCVIPLGLNTKPIERLDGDSVEVFDPMHADELSFYARMKQLKKDKKNAKHYNFNHLYNKEGEEEEERILKQFIYD